MSVLNKKKYNELLKKWQKAEKWFADGRVLLQNKAKYCDQTVELKNSLVESLEEIENYTEEEVLKGFKI